jgi:hypothetical protein
MFVVVVKLTGSNYLLQCGTQPVAITGELENNRIRVFYLTALLHSRNGFCYQVASCVGVKIY